MSTFHAVGPADVAWLRSLREPRGVAVGLEFQRQRQLRHQPWVLKSFADSIKSLPEQQQRKAVTYRFSHQGLQILPWATRRETLDQMVAHWRTFNPSIRSGAPGSLVPPTLQPGAQLAVGRLRLQRVSTLPLEADFGKVGTLGIESPIVHVINSCPRPSPGSSLDISMTWRKATPFWNANPLLHLNLLSGEEEKRFRQAKLQHSDAYIIDIAFLEIHAAGAQDSLMRSAAEAFSVYGLIHGNAFYLQEPLFWSRSHVLRFAKAILERRQGPPHLRGRRAPRFTAMEAAALLHPPPPGVDLTRLPYQRVVEREGP